MCWRCRRRARRVRADLRTRALPFAVVVGQTTAENRLVVADRHFGNRPVDMDMEALLGKPPRMTRDVVHLPPVTVPPRHRRARTEGRRLPRAAPAGRGRQDLPDLDRRPLGWRPHRPRPDGRPLAGAGGRRRRDADGLFPATSARPSRWASGRRWPCSMRRPRADGDRRVADQHRRGVDRKAGRRQALGQLDGCRRHAGEDARLFDTVRAVSDLCQQIGVSIPVGKDSLSMRTAWEDAGTKKQVVSPLSLIVTAFARVADARRTLTPQLVLDQVKPTC